MRTVHVSRRRLLFAALAVVALVGVVLIILDLESNPDEAAGPTPKAVATLTGAEIEAATAAAAHALGEIVRFDHTEGQEAWSEHIRPLCTKEGWAFWTGPFFAGQIWPTVIEQAYVTEAVDLVAAEVVAEGDTAGSAIFEVTLDVTYTLGESGEPIQERKTNRVVMVRQDGKWLMDGPPSPSWEDTSQGAGNDGGGR
jgi:hypothetical protein